MRQLSIRFDDERDAALWAAIQAIPPGRRNAQLKQMLAAAFGMGSAEVLQRLDALERRMDSWAAGTPAPQVSGPAPLTEAAGPPGTPPGWKESLAALGVYDD